MILCVVVIGKEPKVTNKIRQFLTTLFDKDDKTDKNMVRLSSREEFGLHAGEKNAVKKFVKDDEYWNAADRFIIDWVGRRGAAATFEVLLNALNEMGWTSLEG